MKTGKALLAVAGSIATICSTLAFKTQNTFEGRNQLYTDAASPCHRVNVWIVVIGGTEAPVDMFFTDGQCDVYYNGRVSLFN